MPESIHIDKSGTKSQKYDQLLSEITSLVQHETDLIANLANITAVLKEVFNFWWVGFYLVKDNSLVLGPFQGPLACTRIQLNKGVCGTSWSKNETIIVENVDKFPGHIACSSASKSEIVIPIRNVQNRNVLGVLDIDSEHLAYFDDIDKVALEKLVQQCVEPCFTK